MTPSAVGAARIGPIAAVYLSGLLAGMALILFPSAGALLTDPTQHNLTSAQFGLLFTPQIVAAIAASFGAAGVARRVGMKRTLALGLALMLAAMLVLAATAALIGSADSAVFPALLLATAGAGAGFAFTITALNAFAFDLFPGREDSAVTALHVCTGLGQVGAALVLSLFIGFGAWAGAPIAIAVAIAAMLAFQSRLPLALRAEMMPAAGKGATRQGLPRRAWLYAAIALCYGALEATFGNWTPLYLTGAGLTAAEGALGLSLFWGAVTAGRALFAVAAARFNVKPLFYATPIVTGAALLLLPALSGAVPHYLALIVAGLALSYFFPYTISLASAETPDRTAAVSGLLFAGIQLGSGLSANAIGTLTMTLGLQPLFTSMVIFAVVMGGAELVLRRLPKPAVEMAMGDLNMVLPCQPAPCVQMHAKQEANA